MVWHYPGYTDGTSWQPWLVGNTNTVIGIIGGYQQGGNSPDVSYSPCFRANIAALYEAAG